MTLISGWFLKRDETSEARPPSAASYSFFPTDSDIHKNKEDSRNLVGRRTKESTKRKSFFPFFAIFFLSFSLLLFFLSFLSFFSFFSSIHFFFFLFFFSSKILCKQLPADDRCAFLIKAMHPPLKARFEFNYRKVTKCPCGYSETVFGESSSNSFSPTQEFRDDSAGDQYDKPNHDPCLGCRQQVM